MINKHVNMKNRKLLVFGFFLIMTSCQNEFDNKTNRLKQSGLSNRDDNKDTDHKSSSSSDSMSAKTRFSALKDSKTPSRDCKAYLTTSEISTPQNELDNCILNGANGVSKFFNSSAALTLFPGLAGEPLHKLQSGNYNMYKYINPNGDDFYFAGVGIVSQTNFEFVLKLDK